MNIIQANLDKFRGGCPVNDSVINATVNDFLLLGRELEKVNLNEFTEYYTNWIQRNHNFINFNFTQACLTEGSAQSFVMWHFAHRRRSIGRTLRILPGEYFYHSCCAKFGFEYKFFENADEITYNDYVVISLPFSDTGNQISNLDSILERCTLLGVPVLLDLAYINLAEDYTIDFSYPCIKVVTSSLSKGFDLVNYRIGIRWSRDIKDDPIFMHNQMPSTNLFGAGLGLKIMQCFEPNFIVQKYRQKQLDLCNSLDIDPSETVLFGIDKQNHYPELNRGGTTNRVTLSRCYSG